MSRPAAATVARARGRAARRRRGGAGAAGRPRRRRSALMVLGDLARQDGDAGRGAPPGRGRGCGSESATDGGRRSSGRCCRPAAALPRAGPDGDVARPRARLAEAATLARSRPGHAGHGASSRWPRRASRCGTASRTEAAELLGAADALRGTEERGKSDVGAAAARRSPRRSAGGARRRPVRGRSGAAAGPGAGPATAASADAAVSRRQVAAAVGAHGQRREDRQQRRRPQQRLNDRAGDRAADHQPAGRLHHVGDRVDLHPGLQPAGQRVGRRPTCWCRRSAGTSPGTRCPAPRPGSRTSMPSSTKIQLTGKARRPSPAGRPQRRQRVGADPEAEHVAEAQQHRRSTPRTGPCRRAPRRPAAPTGAMGRLRNRSKTPFLMSVLRLTPIASEANSTVCTMIAGSRNCR